MSNIKAFVSVRDRAHCTRECIESLIRTTNNSTDIYIFDNGSDEENLSILLPLYHNWLAKGKVSSIVMNSSATLESVYWSKNFAWKQFLKMMEMLPANEREYLVMIDNDVITRPGWAVASLKVLNSQIAKEKNITVVSPYDGPPDPYTSPDQYRIIENNLVIGDYKIQVRDAASGRLWVASYDFWQQWGPPTETEIVRDSKPDRMPTDWYYWKLMQRAGQRFAVLITPLATDPPFDWNSARMDNKIGADCKKC